MNIYQDHAYAELHNVLEGTFHDLVTLILQGLQEKSTDFSKMRDTMDAWVKIHGAKFPGIKRKFANGLKPILSTSGDIKLQNTQGVRFLAFPFSLGACLSLPPLAIPLAHSHPRPTHPRQDDMKALLCFLRAMLQPRKSN